MATPEELRERLRAKRDAQIQQQHQREAVHVQARQAVQDLIILGYNFPQILELSKGEVSADHLDTHYKALGYYRRKEPASTEVPRPNPPDRFGSPRWLNSEKNYTISLEDSEPESASEDDIIEEAIEQELDTPIQGNGGTNGSSPRETSRIEPIASESQPVSTNSPITIPVEADLADQRGAVGVEGKESSMGSGSSSMYQQDSHARTNSSTNGESNYAIDSYDSISLNRDAQEMQYDEAPETAEGAAGAKPQDVLVSTQSVLTPDPVSYESTPQVQNQDVASFEDQDMTDQEVPHKLPDQEGSGPESSDQHMSDQQISDQQPSVQLLSDQKISDQQLLDQQVSNQQISDQGMSDQRVSDHQMPDEQVSDRQISDQGMSDQQVSDHQMPDEQISDQQILDQGVEIKDATSDPSRPQPPKNESTESQAGLGQGLVTTSPPQAGPEDSDMESSSEEEAPALEDTIQEELRKVQEQIRTMQERKLAKEAQREAEVAMQRRTAELSGIAAKRAVLMQARHKLNMPRLTSRVAKLENKLKNAKETVLSAAVQLKDINAQSMELEKKEIQIRNELARPVPASSDQLVVESKSDAREEEASASVQKSSEKEVEAHDEVKVPPVKVLTAQDSPLRMFGSWRLAPLGPRHWFSPSFNGRFVKDLDIREFCNVDLNGETCVDRDCQFVHYRDFEVPTNLVVEYMATRGINRPGYKDGLIEAIRTHLPGPDAAPEQLAAAVVGFRQQYDSSQVLDWDSWAVDRPL